MLAGALPYLSLQRRGGEQLGLIGRLRGVQDGEGGRPGLFALLELFEVLVGLAFLRAVGIGGHGGQGGEDGGKGLLPVHGCGGGHDRYEVLANPGILSLFDCILLRLLGVLVCVPDYVCRITRAVVQFFQGATVPAGWQR